MQDDLAFCNWPFKEASASNQKLIPGEQAIVGPEK